MPAAVRAFRKAAIQLLQTEVDLVNGRVFTPPVPQNSAFPHLVVSGEGEDPVAHYGGSGASDNGFDVRGVVRLSSGDGPLWALWEQVEATLQDRVITPAGFQPTIASVSLIRPYPDPSDSSVWNFAARCEALVTA